MVTRAQYEDLALKLPGAEPKRHFRYDGFGVDGRQFVHLNKDALLLGLAADEAEAFAAAHPGIVAVLHRNEKPIGVRAALADLPEALAAGLLRAAWRHAGGRKTG